MSRTMPNTSTTNGTTEAPMFKNKLQEYSQKRGLPLPAYRAINEGLDHAPEFRCTVFVDGIEFTSKSTYHRLRDAEQDAARLAYECFLSNDAQQTDAKPLLREDPKSHKSILYEYAWKNKLGIPSYKTRISQEGSPLYVSMVTLAGRNFTGAAAKNKKDSEQLAAHAAIQSLLGTDSGVVITQMVSLKRKRYEALKRTRFSGSHPKKQKNENHKGRNGDSKSGISQP